MSQTDRQPDKATHWKSAIHNVGDNWAKLLSPLPSWIKEIKMKKEIAPTTGSEHYQIHLQCHTQQRLSKLISFIPQTKWFMVIGEEHIKNSIAYISKVETTAPGAQVEIKKGEQYYRVHELLLQIARFGENPLGSGRTEENARQAIELLKVNDWDNITLRMVDMDIAWASKLSNPALRRMWDSWKYAFLRRVEEFAEQTGGAFIIEAPTSEGCADKNEVAECPPELEEELESYAIE